MHLSHAMRSSQLCKQRSLLNHTQKCRDDKDQTGPGSSPQLSGLCAILLPHLKSQLCLPDSPITQPSPHLPPTSSTGSGPLCSHQHLWGALQMCCMKILFIASVTDNGKSEGQPCPAQLTWASAPAEGPACDAEVCAHRGPSSTWIS